MYDNLKKLAVVSEADATTAGAILGSQGPVNSLLQYLKDFITVRKKILDIAPEKYVNLEEFQKALKPGDVGLVGGSHHKSLPIKLLQYGSEIAGGSPLSHSFAVGADNKVYNGGFSPPENMPQHLRDRYSGGSILNRAYGAFLDALDPKYREKGETFFQAFKRELATYTAAQKERIHLTSPNEKLRGLYNNPFALHPRDKEHLGILLRVKGGLKPAEQALVNKHLHLEGFAGYNELGSHWSGVENVITSKLPSTGGADITKPPCTAHTCGSLPSKIMSLLGKNPRGHYSTALPFELLANPNLEPVAVSTSKPAITGTVPNNSNMAATVKPQLQKLLRNNAMARVLASGLAIGALGTLGGTLSNKLHNLVTSPE